MTALPLSAAEQARLDATNLRAAIHDGLAAAGWSFGYRTIADIVVNLPALQRLTQQAAEAARLRETVERVQALADEHTACCQFVAVGVLRDAVTGTPEENR
jgi:hypothetical protein